MEARAELGSAGARRESAAAELKLASDALTRSALLTGEEDCPLCGQALGDAFAKVQSHREAELEAAQARLTASDEALARRQQQRTGTSAQMARLSAEVAAARQALAAWEQACARRETAAVRLTTGFEALAKHDAALAAALGPAPGPETVSPALEVAREELSACKHAAEEASRLRGRLERRPQAELALDQARDRVAGASSLLEALRSKVQRPRFRTGSPDRGTRSPERGRSSRQGGRLGGSLGPFERYQGAGAGRRRSQALCRGRGPARSPRGARVGIGPPGSYRRAAQRVPQQRRGIRRATPGCSGGRAVRASSPTTSTTASKSTPRPTGYRSATAGCPTTSNAFPVQRWTSPTWPSAWLSASTCGSSPGAPSGYWCWTRYSARWTKSAGRGCCWPWNA